MGSGVVFDVLPRLAHLCCYLLNRPAKGLGDIIWLYYGAKWPMLRVGKTFGISEGKARELTRSGVAWIDCAVSDMRRAA